MFFLSDLNHEGQAYYCIFQRYMAGSENKYQSKKIGAINTKGERERQLTTAKHFICHR